jgi:hypothetical protein
LFGFSLQRTSARMSPHVAQSARSSNLPQPDRTTQLTILFWIFSYALLSLRGVMLIGELSAFFSERRALAVSVGAVAYWMALKQLNSARSVSLREAIGWILAATALVAIASVTIDQLSAAPAGLTQSFRWSLAWSGYFGLWVMGAIAFRTGAQTPVAEARLAAVRVAQARAARGATAADWEWLIDTITTEAAAELRPADRVALARRLLNSSGYEQADALDAGAERAKARARVAARIAARLIEQPRR